MQRLVTIKYNISNQGVSAASKLTIANWPITEEAFTIPVPASGYPGSGEVTIIGTAKTPASTQVSVTSDKTPVKYFNSVNFVTVTYTDIPEDTTVLGAIIDLRDDITSIKTQTDKITGLVTKVNGIDTKVGTATTKIDTIITNISSLNTKVTSNQTALVNKVDSISSSISTLSTTLSQIKSKSDLITDLQSVLSTVADDVVTVKGNIGTGNQEVISTMISRLNVIRFILNGTSFSEVEL